MIETALKSKLDIFMPSLIWQVSLFSVFWRLLLIITHSIIESWNHIKWLTSTKSHFTFWLIFIRLLVCCWVVVLLFWFFFFNTHRLFSEAVYPVVCVIYLKCTSAVWIIGSAIYQPQILINICIKFSHYCHRLIPT